MKYYFVLTAMFLMARLGDGKVIIPKKSPCIQKDEYFHPGKFYSFKYEVVAVGTANATTNKPIGGTIIRCDIHLDADENCRYTLRVSKCVLNEGYDSGSEHEHKKSKEFSAAIERYPVVFTMSNGTTDGFQAHEDELLTILNFKRGIITSLITKKYSTKQDQFNDEHTEPRTDVHGTGPVKYSVDYDNSERHSIIRTVMVKDIKNSDLPEREYWRYNPFSLIWNTGSILKPLLSTQLKCYYKYNSDGNLENTNCVEKYSMPMISIPGGIHSKAIETSVRTNLKLIEESSLKDEEFDMTSYDIHGIQYEFENASKPTQNPTDFETTVKSLVEKLATDPENPIHAHHADAFDELIYLLRKSSDLSTPNKHFGKFPAHSSKFTNLDIQRGQIWKDALIQCNRVPCTRAFKEMIGGDPEFVNYIVSKSDLEFIFIAWKNAHINDFGQLKEILEIAKRYTHSRYIIFESAQILYNYWRTNVANEDSHHGGIDQTDFHHTFNAFLSHVEKSFDEQCVPNSGYKDIDVIAALKALSILARIDDSISEKYLKIIEKCIYSKEAHWFIGNIAIEMALDMKRTPQLYNFLLKIFEDPTLTHVEHATAYYILAEKFGSAELVDKLQDFLAKVGEKGYDYNLRTYILTHMRTLAKASYPNRTEYTKALREAMVYNSSLFRAIPEEIAPKRDDENKWEMASRLHLDDDLIFEQGHFSKYSEKHYNYKSPFLKDFVYGVTKRTLYNEDNYFPFAKWHYVTLEGFGKSVTGFNLDFITKGINKVLEAINSVSDKCIFRYNNQFKDYLDNYLASRRKVRESSPHFPYDVDSRILKSLIDLHNSRVQAIPKSDEKREMVLQIKLLDNLIALETFDEITESIHRFAEAYVKKLHGPYPSTSYYRKFIEGSTAIPSLAGITIDYTTDAYFIKNVKFQQTTSEFDGSFSGLVTVKQAMQFDLKGFASFGIQYLSTISSSVGATVSKDVKSNPTLFITQIELPQRPLELLRLTRAISLIKDHEVVNLPEPQAKSATENWCSNKLASILGFNLCHKAHFVPASPDKTFSSLAGNSHWEYIADYIAKHKVALQFGIQIRSEEHDGRQEYHYEIDLKSRDQNIAEKFNTLAKLSYAVKTNKWELETKIRVPVLPTFNIKAKQERLPGQGFRFQAESTIYPGRTTYIDYLTQSSTDQIAESTIDHHFTEYTSSSKLVSVPTSTSILNYTSPTVNYVYMYKFQKFSTSTYADYTFRYKSPTYSRHWLTTIFNHPSFWEDDETAWIKIRNEFKEAYDHQYYSHVKLPKTTIKFTAFHGPASLNDQSLNFNLSKHDSITDEVLQFVNFTSSTVHTTEDGKMSYVMKANATLPLTSLEVELRHDNISPTNINYTFSLRKEEPYYREGYHPWRVLSRDVFEQRIGSESRISSFQTKFRISDNAPYKPHLPIRTPFINIGDIGMKEFYLNSIYHEDERHQHAYELDIQSAPAYFTHYSDIYRRNFVMRIPTENYRFDSTLALDLSENPVEYLSYNAKFGSSSHDETFYSFNISQFSDGKSFSMTEDIKSDTYKSNMQLTLQAIETPSGLQYNTDLDIISHSHVEPILDWNITLKHDGNDTSMKMQDEFVIIEMNSNTQDGYENVINFKSKNLNMVPNMRWQVSYPNDDQGTTIQLDFHDISEVFYIFAHTELNATRLVFHICHTENCTASDYDSENFVAEIELSLENPEKITRTIIYNAELVNFVGNLLRNRITKISQELRKYFTNPAREKSPLKDSIKTTREGLNYAGKEVFKFFLPFTKQLIVNLGAISDFLNPSVTSAAKYYVLNLIAHLRLSNFSWWTYQAIDGLPQYSRGLGDRLNLYEWYIPGPVPEKSYVATIPLPVYWTQFNRAPLQWSPTFAGQFQKLREKFTNVGTARYRERFQDANYTRHAFFSGTGNIYTFDGRIIHPNENFQQRCSYLLSHEFETQKFTIYYQNSSVHFLFPELRLAIGSSGTVVINETSLIELPFASWNEKIRVTRQADLIELNTPYHLKVICKIKAFYCISYTNEHTFNKLIGFLGNNNFNPTDDSDDEVSHELSGETYCRYNKSITPFEITKSSLGLYHNKMFWDDASPTLPCHSIISPIDFLSGQRICDESFARCLQDGYLALCSAKNVPVARSLYGISDCLLGEHNWYSYGDWESKVEDGLDVVFIISLESREHSEQITNGVKKLAEAIVRQWQTIGQTNVSFGLVGYEGEGYRHEPHQHTMNGELLGTYDQFLNHGLKSLTFDGSRQHSEHAALAAVEHAVDYYALREKSHHVFIVITSIDSRATQGPRIRKLVRNLLHASGTLHLLSDFGALENDGYDFADAERNYRATKDLPKGLLASLAAATKGSIWQFSKLEENSDVSKDFAKLVASKIYGNGEERASQCRICGCSFNSVDQPMFYCEHKPCEFTSRSYT